MKQVRISLSIGCRGDDFGRRRNEKWWIASALICFVVSVGPAALAQISYDNGDETVFAHPSYLRGFFRAGWDEGRHESWNYTEVDQTVAVGGDVRGTLWKRPQDKLGLAFAINGISRSHREYLALGGLGFVLGDGRLNYAPEKIVESYYNFPIRIYRGVYGAVDLQYIDDPGYNRDRGPLIVPSLRLHVEL
jgi:carbohydrate-selective porin OprB